MSSSLHNYLLREREINNNTARHSFPELNFLEITQIVGHLGITASIVIFEEVWLLKKFELSLKKKMCVLESNQ